MAQSGDSRSANGKEFTPALGRAGLTHFYDAALRAFTRERRWRSIVTKCVMELAPSAVLDVGCGTGTLLTQLARLLPFAQLVGLDPDDAVLAIAARKADRENPRIEWHNGFARNASANGRRAVFDVVTCTLVLHQVPIAEKKAGLAAMGESLRPGGSLVLADYSVQRSRLMRILFRATVQTLDGVADTQPNADGVLPLLLAELGFEAVERATVRTPSGSISVFTALRPV